jgi:hypothetical protein
MQHLNEDIKKTFLEDLHVSRKVQDMDKKQPQADSVLSLGGRFGGSPDHVRREGVFCHLCVDGPVHQRLVHMVA